MQCSADRSEILIQALPYIREYYGKTVVVKYGGNAMINEGLKQAVIDDIVLLSLVGIKVILVHGGGPEINECLKKMGKESRFINGLRYTDEETIDVVQMVLCGKVNKDLAMMIERAGGKAVGLCGLDSGMLRAEKLCRGGEDYGLVGEVTNVDVTLIHTVAAAGCIPVIATLAAGEDGAVYNINADPAAAKIAAAVGAEKLILLTDTRGLLRDIDDPESLIPSVRLDEAPSLTALGIISGGMIPKVDCCLEAVRRGVTRAHIIDGRLPHSILVEMLTDEGIGTMFTK